MSQPLTRTSRPPRWAAIFLICMAGLLLEVGYTRIVSYKLWYYYTYLVIGLSLLGIGSGGIIVAISTWLKKISTERILAWCSLVGAVFMAASYVVVATVRINTYEIWKYDGGSVGNVAWLALICLAIFAAFVPLGVMISVLLGRAGDGDGVGRLYFADLLGAGLGCLLAVPLISNIGPPTVIILAAFVFAVVGLLWLPRSGGLESKAGFAVGSVITLALVVTMAFNSVLPDITPEESKINTNADGEFSDWGPVFRVDVTPPLGEDGGRILVHDGTYGSGLHEFDGNVESLSHFDQDPRAIPFDVLGGAPERELIIGSAGGNEILASLYNGAKDIEAVELNPVTVSLLKNEYADITGHLPERPEVDLHTGDGRTYLARSEGSYDLVWFVAPDSYAATNAASSGAFVLSESYLYTTEMIEETVGKLSDDGIMVVQFGELDLSQPNRTSRYIVTARHALQSAGVDNPSDHMLVSAHGTQGALSTVALKRTPFTEEEVERFNTGLSEIGPDEVAIHAPGGTSDGSLLSELAAGSDAEVDKLVGGYGREISPVSDDAPFFWHFTSFGETLKNIGEPIDIFLADPEQEIGERVLLLLLALAAAYAAVFLLLPFVAVRKTWAALPAKSTSAVYFACLGLGFMFFEISMIQRLVLFLGYPSYSLTVTLASILVSTGLGALWSRRFVDRTRKVVPVLFGVLAGLTVFYQFGLDPISEALLAQGLAVRILFTLVVLAPLGLCLGMFMPFGLGLVTKMTDKGEDYVAWGWAVNGFFSVIGSVLTTILAMAFGFRTVQYLALAVYALAVVVFLRLQASGGGTTTSVTVTDSAPELVGSST